MYKIYYKIVIKKKLIKCIKMVINMVIKIWIIKLLTFNLIINKRLF